MDEKGLILQGSPVMKVLFIAATEENMITVTLIFSAECIASLEEIQEYMDKKPDKPLLLIEYCHAMGNGPGDFQKTIFK